MAKSKKHKTRPASPKVFPFARYASTVVAYTALLLTSALFLPRITLVTDLEAVQVSSRDKPQHPFLVPLTAKPLLTVTYLVASGTVLQLWWSACMQTWKPYQSSFAHLHKQSDMQRYKNAGLATLTMSVAAHFLIVLFGAPITSHVLHTYSLSCLVAVLAVFTPTYILGIPSLAEDNSSMVTRLTWIKIFAEFTTHDPTESALLYPVIGTILGCWSGALPIPLDWDRPWQSWPLTTAFGAVFGHIIGHLYAVAVIGYGLREVQHPIPGNKSKSI